MEVVSEGNAMLNKFRVVCGEHDGHSTWQCLRCRKMFYAPHVRDWNFCPLCGTRWDGELTWSKPRYPEKALENPYTWVIQERSVFTCHRSEWKDTYRHMKAMEWGWKRTSAKDVLRMWKGEVGELIGQMRIEAKGHAAYCKHMGKDEPFVPFSLGHVRLVLRRDGKPDLIVFEYLPTYDNLGPTSQAWIPKFAPRQ